MLLNKLVYYSREEGIGELIIFLLHKLRKVIYSRVTTMFVYCESWKPDFVNVYSYKFDVFDRQNVPHINYRNGRMDVKKMERSLANGGKVYFFYDFHGEMMGYGIIRRGNFDIEKGIGVTLARDACWLGPIYVYKKFRGKGCSSFIIKSILEHRYKNEASCVYYTCINDRNVASIKAFLKSGFSMCGYLLSISKANKKKSVFVSEENNKLKLVY